MTAPALTLNSDLVAQSWVRRIPAVVALAGVPPVGMTVPAGENPSWAATGFIQVLVVGGSSHPDFELRRPVVSIMTHAVKVTSKEPPWNVAGRLAEYVFKACYDFDRAHNGSLEVVAGTRQYPNAQIIEVNALSEPRAVPGDPAGYARYMFDLQLEWVQP
jgi:hypothetical protein